MKYVSYMLYGITAIPRIPIYQDELQAILFIFQKVKVFRFKCLHHKYPYDNMQLACLTFTLKMFWKPYNIL